ncbi:MAG TPA: hypothetical protein VMU28_08605 [Terriglobales bacterium]|nr:hypothetical protein [Terriglobales bacterium]
MRRIKQFGLWVALITVLVGVGVAVPVKPNLEKMLQQQERRHQTFEPAHAGWNGSEMQRPQDVSPNPVLEAYGPAATVRSIRASLVAAAIPDPKAVVAIAVIIVLMRVIRTQRERREQAANVVGIRTGPPQQEQTAA